MSATHLSRLIEQAARDAQDRRATVSLAEIRSRAKDAPDVRPFKQALLSARAGNPLIAEVKRASPSRGAINPGLDPAALARAYQRGGARCLSVLTERHSFGGSLDDLVAARAACSLPVLRKDFLVTHYQLFESRAFGADAVLIIGAAAAHWFMQELAEHAQELGMTVVYEVHSEEELDAARGCAPDLLGINARDLKTLEVDGGTFARLAPHARGLAPLVAESGVKTADDARRLRAAGADALLVGEALSGAADPESATHALVSA